jgi:hypothetical protein
LKDFTVVVLHRRVDRVSGVKIDRHGSEEGQQTTAAVYVEDPQNPILRARTTPLTDGI